MMHKLNCNMDIHIITWIKRMVDTRRMFQLRIIQTRRITMIVTIRTTYRPGIP